MSSISDLIYEDIESQIINGELKPGDKLPSENELCEKWNTSRISVRQSLERLISLRVLYKAQGKGTFVSEPDPSIFLNPLISFLMFRDENIIDILQFRSIIEVGNVRLCAINRSVENLKNLKKYIRIMDENNIDKVPNRIFAEADLDFHMEIARGSNNPLNVKTNEMFRHVMRKHQINVNEKLGLSSSIKEHKNIYTAIEEKNPELAAHFMQSHISRTIEDIKKLNVDTYIDLENLAK
ncbi:FadR/GntR family transcriptional regulator [Alkalibacter saccharofermentans]|uniref:DNA-binding transcriptional regulator, FadR family n=1 Tax=Alkalibacter saccharofermentans DSM 14828 TaxID=1120975 RepID=A0A1M5A6L2_9FIRM|nr:FadR/GntR family transcriptional regulator [Alkalibacter saccharofermentans]SHF25784.1 DNA-binding transcriptional regulator, FadR family [Alkalibacter saccharofermentans DSM 14828]